MTVLLLSEELAMINILEEISHMVWFVFIGVLDLQHSRKCLKSDSSVLSSTDNTFTENMRTDFHK